MADNCKSIDINGEQPEKSCKKIIEQFEGYVKTVVVNKIGSIASHEDIEDCISDIFAELYNASVKIPDSDDELKYLLGTIAKRRAVDYFRRLSCRGRNSGFLDDEQLLAISSDDDTEKEIENRDLKSALWNAVEQLGEPDSAILIYQYFYRKKIRHIAKILSMSPSAVHKRSLRARRKVKDILIKQGY